MGKTVMSVLEALERYVGPYVLTVLDRVFPSETREKQEEKIDWVELAGQLKVLLAEMKKNTELLSLAQRSEDQNVVPLRPAVEA